MVKAPACEVVLFRLGTRLGPLTDLQHGIRLIISPLTPTHDPELQVVTRGRLTWGTSGRSMVKLKESTWYTVELRGRAYGYYQIHLLDMHVSGDDASKFALSNWVSYQYFSSLTSYQFGALSKDCCKPRIDFDWVCFVDRY